MTGKSSQMSWSRILAIAVTAFVVASFGISPASAQIGSATIEVNVTEAGGAPLPGVIVVATSESKNFRSEGVTDANGFARLAALDPDSYSVEFTAQGFAKLVQRDVVLRVGQLVRLRIQLGEQMTEEVTVTAAAPLVDVYKTDSSTNIIPEQIEDLPVQSREFERLAFITPGVQRERGAFRFIQGGPVIGAGGNASQSTIFVDGVDLTDPALGLSRARFSQDAIREFRVISNRFDTEIGGSAGGALSIVTKSGSNDLAGSVFGFYRAESLRSQGELEQDSDFSRWQGGFTIGGPIVKDKTFFFASFEQVNADTQAFFRPQGSFVDLADDIDNGFDQSLALASLDHRISDAQTLTGKVVYERLRQDNFRVGGVVDESAGQSLERDNWNVTLAHRAQLKGGAVNELKLQVGHRKYFEPTNSDEIGIWYNSGTTLQSGSNIVGDLLGEGDIYELRDTFFWTVDSGRGTHAMKAGLSVQLVEERSVIDLYQDGLLIYLDAGFIPLAYAFGVGSSDVEVDTTIYGAFFQDDWQINDRFTLSMGLRYDYDSDGNNPDFTHPLVPNGRDVDDDNFQPRVAFTWDLKGDGTTVVRGGAGLFAGRYLLVPSFTELQQNGVTGRRLFTRLNGALFGLPQFTLDPNDPANTGLLSSTNDITLLANEFEAPEAFQTSLGFTQRLGNTALYLDVEGIYVEGDKEIVVRDTNWGGNDNPGRPNAAYGQINTYTNEGRSEYKALVVALNGQLEGGHIITGSVTLSDKKNISDDFSPEFPFGYPSDPADIDAEYGPARGNEDLRIVLSGIFKLPYDITIAPIAEYGSGQPWTRRLGYDFNGDGKNSDRAVGVGRNAEDGPSFKSISLRVSKGFKIKDSRLELIAEAFNLFDWTNYDVTSVVAGELLSGPTLANPLAPEVVNPAFGQYTASLQPREIQLGVRYTF